MKAHDHSQSLVPIHSFHFVISKVDKDCTFEQFCTKKKIFVNRCNVFPEISCVSAPLKYEDVRDVILSDKVRCLLCLEPICMLYHKCCFN